MRILLSFKHPLQVPYSVSDSLRVSISSGRIVYNAGPPILEILATQEAELQKDRDGHNSLEVILIKLQYTDLTKP